MKNLYDKWIKYYENKIIHLENIRIDFERKCKEILKQRILIQNKKNNREKLYS